MFISCDVVIVGFQFQKRPVQVPYKAIIVASCLFIAGSSLILIGVMLLAGYVDAKVSIMLKC